MMAKEEDRLIWFVMEDCEWKYKRAQEEQWEGLKHMLALSAAKDVYLSELDVKLKDEVMEEATRDQPPTPTCPLPCTSSHGPGRPQCHVNLGIPPTGLVKA
ncbi:hypothetical protein D1007_52120 [Hordeum vulgare]|nr:hypothetical protein D1007_52120 [Hordeum vulgare]